MNIAKPHLNKIETILKNQNTPPSTKSQIETLLRHYNNWIKDLEKTSGSNDKIIIKTVELLNKYKNFVEIDIIFNSKDDFLYRQKGQLKLDNSILEEFLPILCKKLFGKKLLNYNIGPNKTLSNLYFNKEENFIELYNRSKDQDFSISENIEIIFNKKKYLFQVPIIAAEIKTNLDKTMHQEAASTASDMKKIMPTSKYLILCEYLDMTPIPSSITNIDEVLVLRKIKRISSDIRNKFNNKENRGKNKEFYKNFIKKNPIDYKIIKRLVDLIDESLKKQDKEDFLKKGFF